MLQNNRSAPVGISSNLALIILREHQFMPFTGSLLSIGRQTVYLTPEAAVDLVVRECGAVNPRHYLEIDRETIDGAGHEYITDRSFYSLFSDVKYSCLDISDYEGADVVWDLCEPLPMGLPFKYDLIFNGSCLDNLFDPATAIRNMSLLLKSNGRIIHIEHMTRGARVPDAYLAYSCAWFHNYYAINEFADCKTYLALWDGDRTESPWYVYFFQPLIAPDGGWKLYDQDQSFDRRWDAYGIVIAEKAADSTAHRNPVQYYYRAPTPARDDPYIRAVVRFNSSRRPILAFAGDPPPQHPQYVGCGVLNTLAPAAAPGAS
jgi:SAM-dependent methyltransferase